MKTILYMAMTVNGKIARLDDTTDWISQQSWQSFVTMAQRVGNVIIGRRTYDIVKRSRVQIKDILTVVLTHNQALVSQSPSTIITTESPLQVIDNLKQQGYKEALIGGGGILNKSFIEANLIDEMYIDIEPLVLGRGIPLFADGDFAPRLKLLGVKTLSNHQTIQLHYKVIK